MRPIRRCNHCEHYKKVYMPYIRAWSMQCDVDGKLSPGCSKEYVQISDEEFEKNMKGE